MKMKFMFAASFLAIAVMLSGVASAEMHVVNYSPKPGNYVNAQFFVQTLKYEPYPVNAGDWFDVWVKVQNIGQDDAKNATFELVSEYPFTSNDSVREFGIVPGTTSAYANSQLNDTSIQVNQVIMKFRVKAADNAPDGTSVIKLRTTTDGGAETVFSLPIEIAKTKTDFDVRLKDISPQETSFVVTNVGENTAKAVTVDVRSQDDLAFLGGAEPVSLGDVSQGAFTIVHMDVIPQNAKSMTVLISYTDTAGVRNTVEKTVQIEEQLLQNVCAQPSDKSYEQWTWLAAGAATGAFAVIVISLLRQRRRANKK